MRSSPKRPMAVWIALGILLVYVPLMLVVIFLPQDTSVLDTPDVSDVVADFIEVGGVILSLLIGFLALAMRKQWGRWFVLASLVFIIGVLIWAEAFSEQVFEGSEYYIALLMAVCFGLGPLLIVFLLVSFGPNVKEYFAQGAESRKDV